jgi:hypothetical protein
MMTQGHGFPRDPAGAATAMITPRAMPALLLLR